MQKSRLNREISAKIKEDEFFIATIAKDMGVKISTVERWLKDEDPQLTLPVVINTIKDYLELRGNSNLIEIYETEPKLSTVN